MDIIELKKALEMKNIRKDMYCLSGGFPNESYCLNQLGSTWEVYYSEHGKKTRLKVFKDENSACDYLYELIIKEIS